MSIVSLHDATIAHRTCEGTRILLDHITFCLEAKQRIAIYAPNGSGKTSLLRALTGLDPLFSGTLCFHEKPVRSDADLKQLRLGLGFVIQDARDQLFFPTVLEDVVFGPLNLGMAPKEAHERAHAVLASLGIASLHDRQTHHLSGGEVRLVALAGILAMNPEALLLDEPTTALDAQATTRLTALLTKLDKPSITVSHDISFLRTVCDTFYTIADKDLVSMDPGQNGVGTH